MMRYIVTTKKIVTRSLSAQTRRNLERFVESQDEKIDSRKTEFMQAMKELRNGAKESHWIWYIFPQLKGLGSSPMAKKYEIESEVEAIQYLKHPVLNPRLIEALENVQLHAGKKSASIREVFGSTVDTLKFVSSITLFCYVSRNVEGADRVKQLCEELLQVANAEGYPPCNFTLTFLANHSSST